jgi:hypothetical protein
MQQKNEVKMLIDKNEQFVIMAKIKRAENANLKGSASIKLHRRLTVKYSEMPACF